MDHRKPSKISKRRLDTAGTSRICRCLVTFLRCCIAVAAALSTHVLLEKVNSLPKIGVVAFQSTTTSRSIKTSTPLFDQEISHINRHYVPQRHHHSRNIVVMFHRHRFWSQSRKFLRRDTMVLAAMKSPLTEKEVQSGIDKVVAALRKDSRTNQELGKLQRVTIVLGYGMQQMDTIMAVRFNASFQKSGKGLSSIPLPFGLGQSSESEGRGTMVGQVKASINVKTGKVISCSVFRDLGYGRTFDLKV